MNYALLIGMAQCGGFIAVAWLLGVLTKEHSWVDRGWSILPVVYVIWFASQAGFANTRLDLMTVLAAAWGARLTFNFARKGGYAKGGEDYRWPVLRRKMKPWQWQLFAFFFIAGIQNVILFLLALPAWVALSNQAPLGPLDFAAAALFASFVLGETVADQQQWRFHQQKRIFAERNETIDPPFLTTGLFRWSRHPNFFCEQAIWWSFYLFSVGATGQWLNIALVGPVVLTGLFHGSTGFTEEITLSKYPSYADYQRRTSRLIPWFPGR